MQHASKMKNWKQPVGLESKPKSAAPLYAMELRREQLKQWAKHATDGTARTPDTHSDTASDSASDRETVAAEPISASATGQLNHPSLSGFTPLDSLVCAQELIGMSEREEMGSSTSVSGDSSQDPSKPAHRVDLPESSLQSLQMVDCLQQQSIGGVSEKPNDAVKSELSLRSLQQLQMLQILQQQANATAAMVNAGISTPTKLEQVALIDLHMKTMLHDYAMKRASLLAGPSSAEPSSQFQSKAPALAAAPAAPPATSVVWSAPTKLESVSSTLSGAGDQDRSLGQRLRWRCWASTENLLSSDLKQRDQKFREEKMLDPSSRSGSKETGAHKGCISKSWTIGGRRYYPPNRAPPSRGIRWNTKRSLTDMTGAPPQPAHVHMVCLSSNDSKEGGCGCRQTSEALLEHNGFGSIGEWHVVTQNHANCAGGTFRPATFATSCDYSCSCTCHTNCAVDPAACKCKGCWQRASPEEWVKTTTAPTANGWKDRRTQFAAAQASKKQRVAAKIT